MLLIGPAEAVLSLCGLLTLLGFSPPSKLVLKIVAAVVALFVLVASLSYSAYCHRRSIKCERRSTDLLEERDRLGRTVANLIRSNVEYYYYRSWHEVITVRCNGDTVVERTIEIVPGENATSSSASINMAFMSLSGNEAPEDPSKVAFKVYIQKPDGKVRADSITSWESGTGFAGVALLDREYYSDESVVLNCEWNWPKYSTKLTAGLSESHVINLHRRCDEFKCSIFIEKNSPVVGRRKIVADRIQEFSDGAKTMELDRLEEATRYGVMFGARELDSSDRFGVKLNWTESH